MKKEEILNLLLKSLDKNMSILEKKSNEEIKDIKLMKIFFNKQEALIESFKEDIKKRTMIKKKTSEDLKPIRRGSRLYTPSSKGTTSKSKDRFTPGEKNNFSNLNKSKIDGNYKPKNDPIKINKIIKNNTIERKKYKTPIRSMHSQANSLSKIKKVKKKKANDRKENNNSILTNRINLKNRMELIDSINRANKSFLANNKNDLNKSNNNNVNNYTNGIKKNKTAEKKEIRIKIINKPQANLFKENFDTNKKSDGIINIGNFGDWICSDDGRHILMSISDYLDFKSKYNLFSCKKSYIKFLYQYINDKYTEFKEKNKIYPNTDTIKEKIEEIKEQFSEDDLSLTKKPFNLSIAALKALDILNKEIHYKFFDPNKYESFSDDIYLVYKIIFQLHKNNEIKNAENKKDFYEKMIKYINDNIKEKKVGDVFKQLVNNFDFSKENIYKIKNIIKGNEDKLKPKYYSKICATTGLVIFLVKDILEYLGLNTNNKSNTAAILANLEFLEKMKSKIPSYLKLLQNYIK